MYKLHTETFGGNVHESATLVNKLGWAEYLVSLEFNGGNYSTAVFLMPAEMVYKLRSDRKTYVSDPHHDDCDVKAEQHICSVCGGAMKRDGTVLHAQWGMKCESCGFCDLVSMVPELQNTSEQYGFLLAVELIRDFEDRYGIGNMCSQWTGDEVADDLLERVGLKGAEQ